MKFSTAYRNAVLNLLESSNGSSGLLKFYSGSAPAAVDDAATGTLLCTITLPSDYFAAASGGIMEKTGTWSGTAAASGTVGYMRLTSSGGTAIMQGAHGTDFTLDNPAVVSGQTITINFASISIA